MACFRLRARRVARVAHAETARVGLETAPRRPADASFSALIAGGKVELGTNQGGDMRALELRVAASQVHTDSTPMDAELLS